MAAEIDVSVIITTYNRLWCLPRAIDSCRGAKCHTEIIVVDDGSTDGTWQWLQEQKDVRSFYQENQGQTYAINSGVERSMGTYIRFLDSDDFLNPGTIDEQYQKALNTQAELVCSRVDLYNNSSGKITVCPDIDHWTDFLEVQLGNGYGSHFSGMLFHSSLVKQTPRRPDFALREDRMFLLEVALLNPKMAVAGGCAGYWVQHEQQMQGNYSGFKSQVVNWQHLQIYKRVLDRLEKENRLTDKYKKAVCTVLWPLAHWIAKDFPEDGVAVAEWIYRLDPDFKIPEVGMLRWLYKNMKFKKTERLLKMRRKIVNVFR